MKLRTIISIAVCAIFVAGFQAKMHGSKREDEKISSDTIRITNLIVNKAEEITDSVAQLQVLAEIARKKAIQTKKILTRRTIIKSNKKAKIQQQQDIVPSLTKLFAEEEQETTAKIPTPPPLPPINKRSAVDEVMDELKKVLAERNKKNEAQETTAQETTAQETTAQETTAKIPTPPPLPPIKFKKQQREEEQNKRKIEKIDVKNKMDRVVDELKKVLAERNKKHEAQETTAQETTAQETTAKIPTPPPLPSINKRSAVDEVMDELKKVLAERNKKHEAQETTAQETTAKIPTPPPLPPIFNEESADELKKVLAERNKKQQQKKEEQTKLDVNNVTKSTIESPKVLDKAMLDQPEQKNIGIFAI